MKNWRFSRITIWVIIFIILISICCCLPFGVPVIINNFLLHRFKTNLFSYPLPLQTQVLERKADVGLLTGNGNHCDFWAEQVMVTKLSPKEIGLYYAGIDFPLANSEPQGYIDAWANGIHPPIQPRLEFLGTMIEGQLNFKVSLFDFGYPPGLDFRCH